jgi:hypothetical protein
MSSEWDAAEFFKSTNSGDHGCVEVAFHGGRVGVRDTKDHGTGAVLAFTAREWDSFIASAKAGEFDRPE